MEELINLLQEQEDIEVTDDLREEIENIWPEEQDTDDLFTQEEVNDIVKRRLSREQNMHEQEVQELKDEMEDLVDPQKIQEYETKIDELENKADQRTAELKKDYELQLAATEAGVKDREYFEFLAEKRGFKERLTEDEETNQIVVLNEDGEEPVTNEDGEKVGPQFLMNELKEDKPEVFAESEDTGSEEDIGGGGNPTPNTDEEALENTKKLASQWGYSNE